VLSLKFKQIIVSLLLLLLIFATQAWAQEAVVVIGQDLKVYARAMEGFKEGFNFPFKEFTLSSATQSDDEILDEVALVSPKLICAVGPKAAQAVKIKFPDIPLVFTLVSNPYQYNLNDKNISGISLDVSPEDQFSYLRKILPQATTLGVIYNAERNENMIIEAEEIIKKYGFKLVKKVVEDKSGVPDAIDFFESQKVDAFWIITDPVVANSVVLERLLLYSFSNKVPLVCPAAIFVKKGGLFSVSVSYKKLGEQMADIANKVFLGVKRIEDFGILWPENARLTINMNTANKLGITVSDEVLATAGKVFSD